MVNMDLPAVDPLGSGVLRNFPVPALRERKLSLKSELFAIATLQPVLDCRLWGSVPDGVLFANNAHRFLIPMDMIIRLPVAYRNVDTNCPLC